MRKLITLILALALILGTVEQSRAWVAEGIVAAIIIGGGIIIVIGIKKLANNIPPLENAPPPPQYPTNNMAGQKMLLSIPPGLRQLHLDDSGVAKYDVSGNQFENTDPYGHPYVRYFATTIQSFHGSTWTNGASLQGWASARCVLIIYYGPTGEPIATNGVEMNPYTGTVNICPVPVGSIQPYGLFRGTASQ